MVDSTFFRRKAQALLRFADIADDPTIANQMRDKAAQCYGQAELLSDEDQEHPPRAAVKQSTATR